MIIFKFRCNLVPLYCLLIGAYSVLAQRKNDDGKIFWPQFLFTLEKIWMNDPYGFGSDNGNTCTMRFESKNGELVFSRIKIGKELTRKVKIFIYKTSTKTLVTNGSMSLQTKFHPMTNVILVKFPEKEIS